MKMNLLLAILLIGQQTSDIIGSVYPRKGCDFSLTSRPPFFMVSEVVMKEIELTKGKVAVVDDEDFKKLSKYRWLAQLHRNTWYAIRLENTGEYYDNGRPKRTKIRMHRQILGFPPWDTDHKDHNGLNNKKENLRKCTSSQNRANSFPIHAGFKGVYYRKAKHSRNEYKAVIGYENKHIHIGSFKSACMAARAYDTKARQLFGEFARLNLPSLAPIKIPPRTIRGDFTLSKSGFKGVTFSKDSKRKKRWCVHIYYDSKKHYLGRYKTVEEAEVYNKKAKEKFGDDAFLNFSKDTN